MNILCDGVAFQNSMQRGIQRYFRELYERLCMSHRVEIFLTAQPQAELPRNVNYKAYSGLEPRKSSDLLGRLLRRARIRRLVNSFHGFDVFHSTYFTRGPGHGVPEVVTVHDLLWQKFQNDFDDGWRRSARKHIAAQRSCICAATRIIAISHATSRRLKEWLPQVAPRIRVVHHGAEHLGMPPVATTGMKNPGNYVLFVGQRRQYKNFSRFLQAMLDRRWPRDMRCVAVGPGMDADERWRVEEMGLANKVEIRGFVSDMELSRLYAGATCFAFPSLDEGFGFPLLEAQCRGTVVACSDIEVFHEVAGNGAVYFDPLSPVSIAEAVEKCRDQRLRAELIARGFSNFQTFSWDRCARETAQVFAEAIQERGAGPCT